MKLILMDNLDRETVADILVAENIQNNELADILLGRLETYFKGSAWWPTLKPDNYRLSRGMEDLV